MTDYFKSSKEAFHKLWGDIKRLPKALQIGLFGVVLMYVGVAGMISADAPWLVRGDTVQHVDYVWRLHNGEIPKRSDGIQYPVFVEHAGVSKPQAASKNPPLFYAIHAPFVGSLLNSGHWQLGIAVGRSINIIIGILCILALAWGGWLLGGKNRALHALAVPALTVLIYRFTRLNVDFALDNLLVLFATLSLIFSYKIIKQGPSTQRIVILALLSIAGMYTKVSFIVFLATNLLAIFLSVLVHSKQPWKDKLIKASIPALLVLVGVLVAVGWYYYIYDYKVSGNLYTARPDGVTGGRPVKSFQDVITSSDLWGLFYRNFTRSQVISAFIAGFSLAGVLTIVHKNRQKLLQNQIILLTICVMALAVIGTFFVQMKHAVGIGSINFRYMLPVMLPFGLFLSYGLLYLKWTRGLIMAMVAIFMGLTSIGAYAAANHAYFGSKIPDKLFGGMYTAGADNGVSAVVITLLLLAFIAGSVMFARSVFKLSGSQK